MTLNLRRSLILISLPFCYQSALAPAIAQITPDNTLGSESSVVTPNININGIPSERIDGGAIRDTNLFHSFQELNVGEGRGAYFSNPSGIENILGRVTGINRSNILGTLGVLGNANLFLINPNGIIFGPNARLDLRGSFVGSTANSLMFDNGFEFSATNPQAPPLLTVNIPIGLRFREPAAPILVQGVGQNLSLDGATGSFDPAFGGLRVQPGETLTLAGGNVLLDGGILEAPGGRVELGGLATAGTLALNPDLSFAADTVASADVTLTNRAGINVIANNGGNIAINAQNLNISQASLLTAGIGSNQGFDGSEAGDVQLNATGTITIVASRIENNVNFDAIGNSGDINIITGSLFLTDNTQLDTSTFGQGIGGDILIDALDRVALTDSGIFSTDSDFNSGSPGDILINANNQVSLIGSLIDSTSNNNDTSNTSDFGRIIILSPEGLVSLNQSLLDTTNTGSGLAGDIEINARDEISIANSTIISRGFLGRIFIGESTLFTEASPPARVVIDTAILTTSTGGVNRAGDITINALDTVGINNSIINNNANNFTGDPNNFVPGLAGDVTITANNQISFTSSLIDSTSNNSGTEDFGTEQNFSTISLEAPSGSVILNQSTLDNSNLGTGLAGDIVINARDRIAVANSNLVSEGLQGRVLIGNSIIPTNVIIDNTELTTRTSNAVDTAGDITINALDTVAIFNNSNIANSANNFTDNIDNFTPGFAGNVTIQGNNQVSIISSQIDSTSFNDIRLDGEFSTIRIAAPEGSVDLNQATVDNTNFGSGFAGDIIINARDQVSINNQTNITANGVDGRIFIGAAQDSGETFSPTTVSIDGASNLSTNNLENLSPNDVSIDAGSVNIAAIDNIFITNGSTLEAFTSRNGNAGDVTLQVANGEVVLSNSFIVNTIEPGGISNERGSIDITANSVSLTNGAQLNSGTRGQGDAGNININDADTVSISGFIASLNEDGSLNRFRSSGIFTNTEAEASGAGGDIQVTAGSLQISDGAVLSANSRSAFRSGDIMVDVNTLDITGGGQILTTAFSSGAAGNITVNAPNGSVNISGSNPTLAEGFNQLLTQFDEEEARTRIDIDVDTVTTDVDTVTNTAPSGLQAQSQNISGNGSGDVMITTGSFALRDGGAIETTSLGVREAGDITIVASNSVTLETNSTAPIVSRIFSNTGGSGNAGNISVQADESINIANSLITSEALDAATGNGRTITLTADEIFLTDGAILSATNLSSGLAGNVFLNALNQVSISGNSQISSTSNNNIRNPEVFSEIRIAASEGSVDLNQAIVNNTNSGTGFAGDIVLNARNSVSITNSVLLGDGVAGRIFIGESAGLPTTVIIDDNSLLQTTTDVAGNAGQISIGAIDIVSITDSSIFADSSASGNAGNILVLAGNSINATNSFITSETLLEPETRNEPTGNAGSITLSAANAISLTDNTRLITTNPGLGFAGDIEINASDEISITNQSTVSSDGDFGRIYIGEFIDEFVESSPPRTVMINSSTVSTTESSGLGVAGDIIINARDEVAVNQSDIIANGDIGRIVIGESVELSDSPSSSPTRVTINNASLQTNNSAVDFNVASQPINSGLVSIAATDRVSINSSSLEALTSRNGDGGDIDITARSLSLKDSTIDAGTFVPLVEDDASIRGDAGNITVNVDDDVSLRNSTILGDVLSGARGDGGNITINAESLSLRDESILTTRTEGQGSAGRITINARERVTLRDRSQIESNSETFGQTAGNISITADTLSLEEAPEGEDEANIGTNTRGIEGNINLRVRGLILRQGGRIVANASEEAEGGNITVEGAGGLVALENSDITANAQQGRGGEVRITAQGVFGTEFREENTIESDITATSELGREFFGIVELNTPDVDPSRGLVTLPVNVVDPASLIADNPCQEGEGSEFTVTGRGGLPSNPGESLRRDAVRVDLVEPAQSEAGEQGEQGSRGEKQFASSSTAGKIVPAQGWVSNEKGEVVLTAYAPTSTTPQRPWRSPTPACPAP